MLTSYRETATMIKSVTVEIPMSRSSLARLGPIPANVEIFMITSFDYWNVGATCGRPLKITRPCIWPSQIIGRPHRAAPTEIMQDDVGIVPYDTI